jgi:exosome complex RNA-binding protein Rrp4
MSVEQYKRTHRPQVTNEEKSGKPHQQIYIPKHPDKVIGGEIITRSSWETAFARWCDDNPAVI